MNIILESLTTLLPSKRKHTTGGWISFNCPACYHLGHKPDQRHRGGILLTDDGFIFSCFNCGHKAGWQPGKLLSKNTKDLFKWLGLTEIEIGQLSLAVLKDKNDIPTQHKIFSLQLNKVELPEDCLSVKEWIDLGCEDESLANIVEYIIKERGLSLNDYNWHWSPTNGYIDRVILPFYHHKTIVGWTGRKITPGKPKYLTHSQNGYVFNIDAQSHDNVYTIVVEGQFDAVAIGGVAIMHNAPNEIQCARLNALNSEKIIVPDRDKAGAVMLGAAIEHGWSMSLPPWGDDIKDVADAVKRYGKIYVLSAILHYRISNKLIIELEKKKLERLNDI
jgi:hypothetical protein